VRWSESQVVSGVIRTLLLCAILLAGAAAGGEAQSTDSTTTRAASTGDSIVDRALALKKRGRSDRARALLDSVLRKATPDDSEYANALFWRAAFSATARDSEHLYQRLLVEAPLSPRVQDALLPLARLAIARGDKDDATDHLKRFLLTATHDPQRSSAALWLVTLLFDAGQVARGCDALPLAKDAVPAEDVELLNRLDYFAQRCATLSDSATTAPAATFFSVQVAAYDQRGPADRMARSLAARGLDARVDGTQRPFRVRIGKFPTRRVAEQSADSLRKQGIRGFVASVTAP
jgi:tetratricopeptide (TPR) repeat protein